MRETTETLELYSSALADNLRMFMATVVDVTGSAYRRPGAHMLVVEDGRMAGSISAGCLEHDIIARSEDFLSSTVPQLITYESGTDEIFGLNFGCDGTIRVLVSAIDRSTLDFASVALRANDSGEVMILATVFESSDPTLIGKSHLSSFSGTISSELPDEIRMLVFNDALEIASQQSNQSRTYQYETTRVFFELVRPSLRLVILGAGDDVRPVLEIARTLAVDVTLLDGRKSFLDRYKDLATTHSINSTTDLSTFFHAPGRTAVVVMSHNFELDKVLLGAAITYRCAYLGVMGSQDRTRKLLQQLDALDASEHIHYPIGLDLGAESPEEIALSIFSEILACCRAASAKPLSTTTGPIHKRNASSSMLQLATGNANG
ncbi:MAG: XdhC family protein [Candidatus Obscuribacterales bacterium]|nr:XdhC family protein [Candidatus Obscuribacterales bacterium]